MTAQRWVHVNLVQLFYVRSIYSVVCIIILYFLYCNTSQAVAVAEATLKHSKDQLATEKKNQKTLQKAYDEDKCLLEAKKGEVEEKKGAYVTLQEQSKAAEKAIQVAQQRFQAVTAGLSSNADGQEETLAAQKIGKMVLNFMN